MRKKKLLFELRKNSKDVGRWFYYYKMAIHSIEEFYQKCCG